MLNEKIDLYLQENYYPFHMPGSKRSSMLRDDLPYRRDFTEIEGFDNLNDPKEIFVDLENKIAQIYKVKDAIISTNGSTCGILASIRSLTKDNKNILIQRSCHKAVYNAIDVFELKSDYIGVKTNEIGAIVNIDYSDLYNKLSSNSYSALVITSPSYEGYNLNLNKIYDICKEFNTKLIVDMAHGAHSPLFGFYNNNFDIGIVSFHKTLSALTPSAAVLINDDSFSKEIRRNMAIFQTSSPSYVIVQSIDEMLDRFNGFYALADDLNLKLNQLYNLKLDNLKVIDAPLKDKCKILISTKNTNINGDRLSNLLRDQKIEAEMSYPSYCLLISSIFDRNEGFIRLTKALVNIDKKIRKENNEIHFSYYIPKKVYSINKALNKSKRSTRLVDARNKVCSQFVYAYPPGIPLVVPGELIDDKLIENITKLSESDISLNIGKDIETID